MPRLTFFGAAGEVTGSCYLIQSARARVLLDFGLHQGDRDADRRNRTLPPFGAERIDAVVLTHAHLDHCGRLPLLERHGFDGPIFATGPSCDLAGIILRDSAKIQESDAQDENRRRARVGRQPVLPLYTAEDAERSLSRMVPVPYDEPREVAPGVTARFIDAGHIIGSASVELVVRDTPASAPKTLVFSGDIGPDGAPILRDPRTFSRADSLVLESTYGDRDHRPLDATLAEFEGILRHAQAEKAKVLIPAFAVGRTQDIIFHIAALIRSRRIAPADVYIDSPMAAAASDLYRRSTDVYDPESAEMLRRGVDPLGFKGLRYTASRQESQALNRLDCCAIIIAGSGMCTGGRILHHLRHNLWRPETRVLIVGYQAEGTLGRRLVDGAKMVRIRGEAIAVRAEVHTLGGFSAHAGQSALIKWATHLAPARPRTFLTHGEDGPRRTLRDKLEPILGVRPVLPEWGDSVEI